MEKSHSKVNLIIALSVLIFVFSIYTYMLSPSISFWDCGEYVAAGSSLGVPHPPGNPLYILLARTSTVLLRFISDPAYRINLLTPLFGSFTAMLIYLSIIRILIGFMGVPDTLWNKLTLYISGIVGSLFAMFSNTLLFSAVEAEVNMPLLLPIMLSTWLSLVWAQSKNEKRDRLLLLISYISFLGIGIHMYSMITLLPIFVFVVITDRSKLIDWRLWTTGIAMSLVMYDISLFLYIGTATIIVTLIFSFLDRKNKVKWRFCFQVAALAFLGFSSHLYIPIRSNLNPSIDENHPATFQSFKDYLDRKQYGSESMISRMMWRRGSWENQFGIEGHMGFGGFLATQFFHFSLDDTKTSWFAKGPAIGYGKLFVYSLPVLFMVLGWLGLLKRSRNTAILIITLTLMNTVAMVLYMNFADGTKAEKRDYIEWEKSGKQGPMPTVHREVRVRDYFYITGFMYYGMCIGLSSGLLLFVLYTNRNRFLSTCVAPIVTVFLTVSPALPMTQNIPINNRHGDMIPYDYAYNLLMSVEQGGILFTNGDNDTFPLWALQEAFGTRKDIRIVNLSLLNTDWYILQLKKNEPRIPLSLTEEEIKDLNHLYNPYKTPTPFPLPQAAITATLPDRQHLPLLQIQHQMILRIIEDNKWKKPVYFATTVSENNFLGLDTYLSMQGFVYRLMPDIVSEEKKFDIEKTEYLIDSVYKFRGLNTWRARHDETTNGLINNYSALFLKMGLSAHSNIIKRNAQINKLKDELQSSSAYANIDSTISALEKSNKQDFDRVMKRLDQLSMMIPWDWRTYIVRQELYSSMGKADEAEKEISEAVGKFPDEVELLQLQAQLLIDNKKLKKAVPILKKLSKVDDDPSYAFFALSRVYQDAGYLDSANSARINLKKLHPTEPQIDELIKQNEFLLNRGIPSSKSSDN